MCRVGELLIKQKKRFTGLSLEKLLQFSHCLSVPSSGSCSPPPAGLQRCGQVMKPAFKVEQGMSTNGEACYDKLDKAIVALSRLDDCTQSTSLRTFFSLHLARDSSIQSGSWGASDTPTHNYTSPFPLPSVPCPSTTIPIKGLAWSVDR